jgi:hypothetical protein
LATTFVAVFTEDEPSIVISCLNVRGLVDCRTCVNPISPWSTLNDDPRMDEGENEVEEDDKRAGDTGRLVSLRHEFHGPLYILR